MVKMPNEGDFGPYGQLLVRKGMHWEILHLREYHEALKYPMGMSALFYFVDEWRKIEEREKV